ncbi:MAG TPA: hypothetical protein VGM88_25070 [Kofleriaceae bacterium]|jgi:hypothetical protein
MRAFFYLALAACAPAVHTSTGPLDEDLESRSANAGSTEAPPPAAAAPPAAPAGTGARHGVISRAALLRVLDAGPGMFLRQVEVAAHMKGGDFVGWQIVQILDRSGPIGAADIAPGDVLLAVNGRALARPDDLQTAWDQLRTAPALDAELTRGATRVSLHFDIH